MNIRQRLRNNFTGIIFGKYDLEKQVNKYLIRNEEYISGIEIIYYDELTYLLAFLILITFTALSYISLSFIFFGFAILIYLVYIATSLELVYLTNERLIIERRTIIEKVLRTSNFQTISIDQIAVLAYSRAPFQYPTLLFGLATLGLTILNTYFSILTIHPIIIAMLLLIALYFIKYGLRLTKRSIEISVIGVSQPFGIGRVKGAPLWFLDEIQQITFERVHHTFHHDTSIEVELREFPMEKSGMVKELINKINKPLQKQILFLLDEGHLPKKEIIAKFPKYTKVEIDEAMRQLRRKKYIFYHRSINCWCINRENILKTDIKLSN